MTFGLPMILPPSSAVMQVRLEPVYNLLNSFGLLDIAQSNPGVDPWVMKIYMAISDEAKHRQMVILWGIGLEPLTNLIPSEQMTSFPAYLDAVAALDPIDLRDHLLYWGTHSAHHRAFIDPSEEKLLRINPLEHSLDAYITYIEENLQKEVEMRVFEDAYHLFHNPPQLQEMLVTQMRFFWEHFGESEWERVRPILEEVVRAFEHIPLEGLPIMEALRVVTGRELRTIFDEDALNHFERIDLIPSRHNGPYLTWFGNDTVLRIGFGARLPAGTPRVSASPLDHVEVLNRLTAMGDETRLEILLALKQHTELGTQQIMEQFNLNKSAASRHLRNLHASGLIIERRDVDNKSKFYSLNTENISTLSDAIRSLLL